MSDELSREQVVAVIETLVAEFLDESHITEPPIDALTLAQVRLGMVVSSEKQRSRPGIKRIRQEASADRQQWAAAHAIGEHFKPTILQRLGLEGEQSRALAGESLANLFAYRLLAPSPWFADDVRTLDYDLLELKSRYTTASHEVLAWRFLDLNDPCIVTIIDNDTIHRRRGNGPRVRRKLAPAEDRCWRGVVEQGQPFRVQEHGWSVQGWPILDLEWKREILRSVVDLEDMGAVEYDS